MRRTIFICLFVASCSVTGHTEPLFPSTNGMKAKNHDAQARYTRSHRHRHNPRVYSSVYDPSRDAPRPLIPQYSDKVFPNFSGMAVIYPHATGTAVLDAYSGRRPVISAASCANPTLKWEVIDRDITWTPSVAVQ